MSVGNDNALILDGNVKDQDDQLFNFDPNAADRL